MSRQYAASSGPKSGVNNADREPLAEPRRQHTLASIRAGALSSAQPRSRRAHPSAVVLWVLVAVAFSFGLAACSAQGSSNAAQHPKKGAPDTTPPAPEQYQGTAPAEEREAPPAEGITPSWSFPPIQHLELANGLNVRVVEQRHLPLVNLRVVLLSGQATDGNKPGLAVLAGEMLKAGGTGSMTSQKLLDRVESLGSSLAVSTTRDETTISMSVTRQHLETALGILAEVVQKPRFLPDEFRKLKRREMDRVSSLVKSSPNWVASMVLYRELFAVPSGVHPYATFDATSKQIEQVLLQDCKTWYASHATPKNSFIVVSGDVTAQAAQDIIARNFGNWSGEAPAEAAFAAPEAPSKLSLYLVDRPESAQAEVYVATLGPERKSEQWVPLKVINQVLGGGVAGRLFLDVREQRSLAYRTYSDLDGVASGPAPVVLSAGTQTAKAGLALQALLEHFDALAQTPATERELKIATRYLSDTFLLRIETVEQLADLTSRLGILGLPDNYYDEYRREVMGVSADTVQTSTRKFFRTGQALVVVAGDAKRLAKPLSHFAPVHVVDPEKDFVTREILPHDPAARIELDRMGGT